MGKVKNEVLRSEDSQIHVYLDLNVRMLDLGNHQSFHHSYMILLSSISVLVHLVVEDHHYQTINLAITQGEYQTPVIACEILQPLRCSLLAHLVHDTSNEFPNNASYFLVFRYSTSANCFSSCLCSILFF